MKYKTMEYAAFSQNINQIFENDENFCRLYPPSIRLLDGMHWSPLEVIQKSAEFLAGKKGTKVLDIGSGAGKFCLAASYYKPKAFFYGVEQRQYLIDHAEAALKQLGKLQVTFINGNFTQLNLQEFDSFYFYNSFFESLPGIQKIDDSIDYSPGLYDYYCRYMSMQLDNLPSGT
ncbi:MAG: methyltransferase domain-containing protein, partial [Bacteroidetes bacterium]|nr:methyltransferase domain-containing protein [Bacteroidota bacterium]